MSNDKPALPKWEDLDDEGKAARAQVAGTDFVRSGQFGPVASVLPGGFAAAHPNGRAYQYGKASNFEEDDLNAMLDLVGSTKPSDLAEAAEALQKASEAIHAASEQLERDIKTARNDWEGEAGVAFEEWGTKLAKTTGNFAIYVKAASIETQAAGMGLSSVKGSLPPRDTRMAQKRPEHFTEVEKVDTNPDYTAAKKVEKDRQEAINQMNRLASFYSVSAQGLSKLQEAEPTFEMMPDVGMPQPPMDDGEYDSGTGGAGGGSTGTSPTIDGSRRPADDGRVIAPPHRDEGRVPTPPTTPRPDIGTVIDTVQTPPAPTVDRPVGPQPTVPGPGPNQGPTTPPFTPGPYQTGPGLPRGGGPPAGKNLGPTPGKTGPGPQGRPTDTTRPPTGQGRTGDAQGGRQSQTGQGGGRQSTNNPANGRPSQTGRTGGTGGRQDQTGRAIQGGTQRSTKSPGARDGGKPANREGITGGRQAPTGRNVTGKPPQSTSRGNVIGNQDPAANRSTTGRVSQRGVMGAPQAGTSASRSSGTGRTVQGASGAVSGQPTARNSAGRTARQGFSAGGSGLVRPGQRQDRDEEEQEGTERPEWLVEDPETHMPDRPRPNVPPVIN